jgi:hypothetical protein
MLPPLPREVALAWIAIKLYPLSEDMTPRYPYSALFTAGVLELIIGEIAEVIYSPLLYRVRVKVLIYLPDIHLRLPYAAPPAGCAGCRRAQAAPQSRVRGGRAARTMGRRVCKCIIRLLNDHNDR